MSDHRPFMIEASHYDTAALLDDWQWLVPPSDTPLFLSVLGDWVFGHPDGSLWLLSVLEGHYTQIARDASEYNTLNKSAEWIDQTFIAGWATIAAAHGLRPQKDECLGWKIHPIFGSEFAVHNLQVYPMNIYQSLMGQLHRQVQLTKGKAPFTSAVLQFPAELDQLP